MIKLYVITQELCSFTIETNTDSVEEAVRSIDPKSLTWIRAKRSDTNEPAWIRADSIITVYDVQSHKLRTEDREVAEAMVDAINVLRAMRDREDKA